MRLIRVVSSSARQVQDACLEDLEALLPGGSILGRSVAVPGHGAIDLVAAGPGGRLALVSFHLEAAAVSIAGALAQWDWVCENLPAMRALGGFSGEADPTADPRLILAAQRVTQDARRMAGRIGRPAVELFEVSLVSEGREPGRVGILLDAVATIAPPPLPAASVDPLLGALPAGEARSLVRRLVEQMRDDTVRFVPLDGGVDVERDGRLIGSVLTTPAGVEARRARDGRSLRVETDEDCREAVRFLSASTAPAAMTLTPEEIEELERAMPRVPPPHTARPSAGAAGAPDVEN